MSTTESGHEWEETEGRKVRERTESNRIITLTGEALDTSGFADGTEVSIFARPGEIRLYRWGAGIPREVTVPHDASRGKFLPCGVREVHSSGTSIIVTLTDRALTRAGFATGEELSEAAHEDAIKLTAEEGDQ